MNLNIIREIPNWLLTSPPHQIYDHVKTPTLVDVKGVKQPKLFVSVLLHGNECSGYVALQNVLRTLIDAQKPFPRDLMILIGNPQAAAYNLRHLPQQPDFNRLWDIHGPNEPIGWVKEVLSHVRQNGFFAAIDIHNNSGKNPFYACMSSMKVSHGYLASLFSRSAVFFEHPSNALSVVLSQWAPAITIECGQSWDPRGIAQAEKLINAALMLEQFPSRSAQIQDLDLHQLVARIRIDSKASVAFVAKAHGKGNADILLYDHLEDLNFRPLEAGYALGQCRDLRCLHLEDDRGGDMGTETFLRIQHGQLVTTRPIIPSMLTTDLEIIRSDCLGYFMEPKIPTWESPTEKA